jgi:hypothetical protein
MRRDLSVYFRAKLKPIRRGMWWETYSPAGTLWAFVLAPSAFRLITAFADVSVASRLIGCFIFSVHFSPTIQFFLAVLEFVREPVVILRLNEIWTTVLHSSSKSGIYYITNRFWGARGGAVGWGTTLKTGRWRVRFPIMSLEFFIGIILSAALWPWGRLTL